MHDCVSVLKPLALAVLLTGCAVSSTLQQRYVGTLRGCGSAQTATLTRIRDDFAFSPGGGSLLIRGHVGRDGTLAGQLNTQPKGRAPYVLAVSGRIEGDAATLRYATPRCVQEGRLRHVTAGWLP